MRRTSKGFTLIELMVVLAVIAILAAIAIPSYNAQVRKSRRADATRFLGNLQLQLERWRAENPCYGPSGVTSTGTCPTFTASGTYPAAPDAAASPYYTIAITAATPTTFSLTATPTGAQSGDTCGVLTLAYDPSSGTSTTRIGKPQWATASCN